MRTVEISKRALEELQETGHTWGVGPNGHEVEVILEDG